MDIYNIINSAAVLTYNQNFIPNGTWLQPQTYATPRTMKFTLQWDSHGVANGTYALTARVRDAVGQATTSAGVTVTISN